MEQSNHPPKLSSSHVVWRRIGIFFLVVFLALGVWYARSHSAQQVVSGVVGPSEGVLKNDSGVTNVLLLGMGGDGHAGGDLTDSMLLMSFDLSGSRAKTIAIPRDIWVPSMQAKINTAYHYGGLELARTAVNEILGIPVHYVVTLDFQGFVKAIDAVGGIEVMVENTFDDFKYPIPGQETAEPESDRYEHVRFEQGTTQMDGATALKFARSRHAEGDEGTDFARGKRQEKIILAFRSKLFSTQTIFNSSAIDALKSSIIDSIDTDIESREQGAFFKVFLGLGNLDNVESIAIQDYFINPKVSKAYGGQWVLIPATTWEEIHEKLGNQLSTGK